RRIGAFYLAQNDMISGYGPVGAAMALLFWVYISSIIIPLGAELGYAVAKERRRILPGEEMVVVAAPGEQPTPKFAPRSGVVLTTPMSASRSSAFRPWMDSAWPAMLLDGPVQPRARQSNRGAPGRPLPRDA